MDTYCRLPKSQILQVTPYCISNVSHDQPPILSNQTVKQSTYVLTNHMYVHFSRYVAMKNFITVRDKMTEQTGLSRGYQPLNFNQNRNQLLQYLPSSQKELPTRCMQVISPMPLNIAIRSNYNSEFNNRTVSTTLLYL